MVLLMLTTVLGMAYTDEGPHTTALKAGKTIDVGTVTVWNGGTTLFVEYETGTADDGDWFLSETHLAVGPSLNAIPQNKAGNPTPGKFEYKTDHSPSIKTYTYEIPLVWNADVELFVAAHAVVQLLDGDKVVQEETGWGEGDDTFTKKNWAMYFKYTVVGTL